MECYLELAGGGRLILNNHNGYLLLNDCLTLLGGTPGPAYHGPKDYHYHIPHHTYLQEQEKLREKQEKVITLKLEAQENLIRQKELQSEQKNKQSARQLLALEREIQKINVDLQKALYDLQKYNVIKSNNEALLILMMAYPYLNITSGGAMH